jgi:DNA-binding XRE family transcriptional regulator
VAIQVWSCDPVPQVLEHLGLPVHIHTRYSKTPKYAGTDDAHVSTFRRKAVMTSTKDWLAKTFKTKRQAKGWSQTDLAEFVGLTRSTYINYECGRTEPSLTDGLKLCKLLEIDPRNIPLRESDVPGNDLLDTGAVKLPGGI